MEKQPLCFIVMPYHPSMSALDNTIRAAVAAAGCRGKRADDRHASEWLSPGLMLRLRRCDLVIAVFTGNNPNVLWETGFAMALQKPVIALTDDASGHPTDISGFRMLSYRQGQQIELQAKLSAAIGDVLGSGIRAYRRVWEEALLRKAGRAISRVRRVPDFMSETAYLRYLTKRVSGLLRGQTVEAVCGKKDWSSAWVREYFEANRNAAARGVEITRLFVLVDEAAQRAAEAHVTLGVNVRTIDPQTVSRLGVAAIPLDLGFALIDRSEGVAHWEAGETINGCAYSDPLNLLQGVQVYEELLSISRAV